MNLMYGEIMRMFQEDGLWMGTICVRGAMKDVALPLIEKAQVGDVVLLCDGVAISKVQEEVGSCVWRFPVK